MIDVRRAMSSVECRRGSGWGGGNQRRGAAALLRKRYPGAAYGRPADFGSGREFRAVPAFLEARFCLAVLALGLHDGPEMDMGLLGLGEFRRSHPEEDEEERERQDDRPPELLIGEVKFR